MFTFLHAADIHLDSPLRGIEAYPDAPVEQIRSASRRAFDNLVELAVGEGVSFVLLAGDIYDGDWKDYNTGLYFVSRMGQLRDAGIRVFMVSGNHDAASRITRSLRLPDNVTLFGHRAAGTMLLEHLGVAIHGRSFSSSSVTEDLVPSFPVADPGLFSIGLLHTSLNGRQGHEPYAPTSVASLRSRGYDYWALGHVHQREVVARDPWIVFPGNIQGRHIRETGAKGCSLIRVQDGRVEGIEHRDLDVLRWDECSLDVSGCLRCEAVVEKVFPALEACRRQAGGRPLALRLGLEHDEDGFLVSESVLFEELRAVAAGLGDVWIERIALRARAGRGSGGEHGYAGVLGGLWDRVNSLGRDGLPLCEGIADLEKLRLKLPHELLQEGDPFAPEGDELEELRAGVLDLLALRMAEGGRHED